MGQVPAFSTYLILGGGRTARHIARYLGLLALPYEIWTRNDGTAALESRAARASHVLVLVSDRAIESVLKSHPVLSSKVCVHFSGAVTTPLAIGAHPLMTFAESVYSLADYECIPFVIEKGNEMSHVLPGLANPSYEIEPSDKPLYHALCTMAGNYTVLLWEKVFASFDREFHLPKAVLLPYLQRIAKNLAESDESVLTGPLARGDRETIASHLRALDQDPYLDVYRAFVSAHGRDMGGSS